MKKHEIARENVMTTVGRVTVAVYATDSTDKQTLSTVLYDGKSRLVSGISAQMTYRPGSGLALEDAVKNIIARTSTKYEASQRPLCEHIDYAQAYAELKSANMLHQLCPVEWRAESTRRAALLEGIILDPNHSAHPAYAPAVSNSSPQVCHAIQKYIVPADTPPGSTVTVTIRCHDHDRANVRLPGHIQVADRTRSSLSPQQSSMPDIQEIITEDYYTTLQEDAQKIYRKAKEIR